MPDLKVGGVFKKIMNTISGVHHSIWIVCIVFIMLYVIAVTPEYVWLELWFSIRSQKVLLALVFIFCIIAISLVWTGGQKLDVLVFRFFNMNGHRPLWMDWAMLIVTQLGNFAFAAVLAVVLILTDHKIVAYELIFGVLSLGLIVQTMKTMIHRTRPYIKLENIRIVGERASGQSFPSGHTCQSFYIATLLLHYFSVPIVLWIGLYLLALLVGITRIYVGMHYPRDVLGGAVLGTAWGLFGVILNSYLFFFHL